MGWRRVGPLVGPKPHKNTWTLVFKTARKARIYGLLGVFAMLLSAQDVAASGIVAPAAGGWDVLTLGTPTAMHLNPAVLRLQDEVGGMLRPRLQVDVAGVIADVRYQRTRLAKYQYADGFVFKLPLDSSAVDPSKTGVAAEVTGQTRLPTIAIAWTMPLGDRWAIGISAVPEHAAVLKMPDEGAHKWQLQEVMALVEEVSFVATYQPLAWLHLGASVDVNIGTLSLRQALDLAGTDMLGRALADEPINQPNDFSSQAPPGVRELDVLTRNANLNGGFAIGVGFSLGAVAQLSKTMRLAVTWQQGVDLTYVGDFWLDMDHDFFTTDLASQGLKYPRQVKGKAYVEFPTPSVLRAGWSWQPTATMGLHVQGSWLRYSVIESLDVTVQADGLAQPELGLGPVTKIAIDRSWNDTFEVEGLATFRLGQAWQLGVRGGFHTPVAPDRTMDMLSLDGDRFLAGITGRFALSDSWTIAGHALLHQVLDRHVAASDYDRGNGVYGLRILVLGMGTQVAF